MINYTKKSMRYKSHWIAFLLLITLAGGCGGGGGGDDTSWGFINLFVPSIGHLPVQPTNSHSHFGQYITTPSLNMYYPTTLIFKNSLLVDFLFR